ncbi:hypothetical protein ABPG72_022784 [Tetrahymena utriculariae]
MSQQKNDSNKLDDSLRLRSEETYIKLYQIGYNNEKEISELYSRLNNNPNLQDIALYCYDFNDEQFSELGAILGKCSKLVTLFIEIIPRDGFTGSSAYDFASSLANCPNLTTFELRSQEEYLQIQDDGAIGIGLGLGNCPNLTTLRLEFSTNRGDSVGAEGAAGLGAGLSKSKTLRTLYIDFGDYYEIGDEGVTFLANNIGKCSDLKILELILKNNQFGDEGLSGIVTNLINCTNFEKLNLSLYFKVIGEQGMSILSSHLGQVLNLTSLTLMEDFNHYRDFPLCLNMKNKLLTLCIRLVQKNIKSLNNY